MLTQNLLCKTLFHLIDTSSAISGGKKKLKVCNPNVAKNVTEPNVNDLTLHNSLLYILGPLSCVILGKLLTLCLRAGICKGVIRKLLLSEGGLDSVRRRYLESLVDFSELSVE